MKLKFQHELLGLSDDDAIEILITIARMSEEYKDMWHVIRNCPYEGKKRDYFIHYCSYLIGLAVARNMMCNIPCCQCQYEKVCPVNAEIKFVGDIVYYLKTKGEEEAKRFIKARLNTMREVYRDKEVI